MTSSFGTLRPPPILCPTTTQSRQSRHSRQNLHADHAKHGSDGHASWQHSKMTVPKSKFCRAGVSGYHTMGLGTRWLRIGSLTRLRKGAQSTYVSPGREYAGLLVPPVVYTANRQRGSSTARPKGYARPSAEGEATVPARRLNLRLRTQESECVLPIRLGRLRGGSDVWKSWRIHMADHDRRGERGIERGSETLKESRCEHVNAPRSQRRAQVLCLRELTKARVYWAVGQRRGVSRIERGKMSQDVDCAGTWCTALRREEGCAPCPRVQFTY
jgi:hypothetical protein